MKSEQKTGKVRQDADDRRKRTGKKPATPSELGDDQLSRISGGAVRSVRGGDDDLKDLEVER